jgi:hypothetical protein
MEIIVRQMPEFKRAYKKLHHNQRRSVDQAILDIVHNPSLGTSKKGDLAGVCVYKFNCVKQEMLLAYEYDAENRLLLALGLHENFYRDLKRQH